MPLSNLVWFRMASAVPRYYVTKVSLDAPQTLLIYNEARRALIRTYAHTRRRALDEEKAIRLRIPGWQPSPGEGPVAEWETEWLASGFFSSEGECELPETLESVRGVAANGCAVSTVALLCVCLLYTSPSPRDKRQSRMPSSA